MHQPAFVPFAIALLLPLAVTANLGNFGSLGRISIHDKTETVCSVDTSDAAVVPFADNTHWVDAMTKCSVGLEGDSNDGLTCAPKDQNGAALGPTFDFWKAETGKDQDPAACYDECINCLASGIDQHLAVTTSCQFKVFYARGPAIKGTCNMGFDYGTMQANQSIPMMRRRGLKRG